MGIPEDTWETLVAAATAARKNAHAPYSGFAVGAAVLAGGKVYAGCNVENASYPVGICAERGAMAAAVADGQHVFDAVVVVGGVAISPCGMCRQALVEFGPEMPVLMVGQDDQQRIFSNMQTLLPARFEL
jgi:cytidine deaminase